MNALVVWCNHGICNTEKVEVGFSSGFLAHSSLVTHAHLRSINGFAYFLMSPVENTDNRVTVKPASRRNQRCE
jgi:hypothetical protein